MLTTNDVTIILRRLSGMLRTAVKSNSNGIITFDGGVALNDLVIDSDGYTGTFPVEYIVKVSSTGSPDNFRYSTDNGVTWNTEAAMSASKVSLLEGIGVKWSATTGHTLGTEWKFTVCPSFAAERIREMIGAQSDFEVLNDMVSTMYTLGKTPEAAYTKIKTEVKATIAALVNAVDAASLDAYLISETAMVNAEIKDLSIASVTPAQVVPKPTILGEYVFSDVDTGVWTTRDMIDVSKYNGGKIELFTLSAITDAGSDGIATIQGVDFDGTVVDESVTVAFGGSLSQYETVDLSTSYTQRWKTISSITVTGGAAGQAFQIRTKEDFKPIL